MKIRTITFLLGMITLSACEKAKDMAKNTGRIVKEQVSETIAATTNRGKGALNVANPELAKLVDQTPEGVIFRKDLPFPQKINVTLTSNDESSYRLASSSSPLESHPGTLHGTGRSSALIEWNGSELRHTSMKISLPEATDGKPISSQEIENAPTTPAGPPLIFRKSGERWTADMSSGFRALVMIKELAPYFNDVLIDNALLPRPLWFTSKKRFKPGDSLTLSDESLSILMTGKTDGKVHLKLETLEPVHGHPCAVFSITGDYKRRDVPKFDGNLTDDDVTVESWKIWFSLIHPVILKEEIQGIQNFSIGAKGSEKTRGQGSMKTSRTFKWETPGS